VILSGLRGAIAIRSVYRRRRRRQDNATPTEKRNTERIYKSQTRLFRTPSDLQNIHHEPLLGIVVDALRRRAVLSRRVQDTR